MLGGSGDAVEMPMINGSYLLSVDLKKRACILEPVISFRKKGGYVAKTPASA
jgi:hypothetical protein